MNLSTRLLALFLELLVSFGLALIFLIDADHCFSNMIVWFVSSILPIAVAKYIDHPWFTRPSSHIAITLLVGVALYQNFSKLEVFSPVYDIARIALFSIVFLFVLSIIYGFFQQNRIGHFLYHWCFRKLRAEVLFLALGFLQGFLMFPYQHKILAMSFLIALFAFMGPIGALLAAINNTDIKKALGEITGGSQIGRVFIRVFSRHYFRVGDVIQCNENNEEILLQVVNATTLDKGDTGLLKLECTILGSLKKSDIEPYLYSFFSGTPITIPSTTAVPNYLHYAGTNIRPKIDYTSLVTHNTAVIGTLGSGKTRFAMQLVDLCIKNINDLVIVCFDVTNEWINHPSLENKDENNKWFEETKKELEIERKFEAGISYTDPAIEKLRQNGYKEKPNIKALRTSIDKFYNMACDKKGLFVINVNELYVLKWARGKESDARNNWYKVTEEMSLSQIVSEFVLRGFKRFNEELSKKAQLLFVFEEAHSLTPEVWGGNVFDDERESTLHTARVIMQGRKFGIGCFTISQRTASVSKSILTQCNTVFALQQFDNTGLDYFRNYFGDIASQLPNLEERQAMCLGKGIKRSTPIIVKGGDYKLKGEKE